MELRNSESFVPLKLILRTGLFKLQVWPLNLPSHKSSSWFRRIYHILLILIFFTYCMCSLIMCSRFSDLYVYLSWKFFGYTSIWLISVSKHKNIRLCIYKYVIYMHIKYIHVYTVQRTLLKFHIYINNRIECIGIDKLTLTFFRNNKKIKCIN